MASSIVTISAAAVSANYLGAARAGIAIWDAVAGVSTLGITYAAEGASITDAARAVGAGRTAAVVGGAPGRASWCLDQQAHQVGSPGRVRSQGGRGHHGSSAKQGKSSHRQVGGSLHGGEKERSTS